jgi:hypothetical protein
VLAEVGLDVGKALGHEGVEPLLREVVVDPVQPALSQCGSIIGSRALVLHGPFGPFSEGYGPAFHALTTATVFANANSSQGGTSPEENHATSATSSAGSGSPETMRAVQ